MKGERRKIWSNEKRMRAFNLDTILLNNSTDTINK